MSKVYVNCSRTVGIACVVILIMHTLQTEIPQADIVDQSHRTQVQNTVDRVSVLLVDYGKHSPHVLHCNCSFEDAAAASKVKFALSVRLYSFHSFF